MPKHLHVKKGDEVVIIAGSEKGKRGKIIEIHVKSERVIVEGAKMIKHHTKRTQQNPQGAIIEREGTIHVSNVIKSENFDKRMAKRNQVQPASV